MGRHGLVEEVKEAVGKPRAMQRDKVKACVWASKLLEHMMGMQRTSVSVKYLTSPSLLIPRLSSHSGAAQAPGVDGWKPDPRMQLPPFWLPGTQL